MSGGVTTYVVVEPMFPWELRSRLLRAAEIGTTASFDAETSEDPSPDKQCKTFTVKVTAAQFQAPVAFELLDEDENYIQIRLPELGPVEFEAVT